jgi:hypothetical protein
LLNVALFGPVDALEELGERLLVVLQVATEVPKEVPLFGRELTSGRVLDDFLEKHIKR